MMVINGRNSSITFGNSLFRISNIGICVPRTTNVPFEIVLINFVAGILSESQNTSNDVDIAHKKNMMYE